jgi:hypothetical protein
MYRAFKEMRPAFNTGYIFGLFGALISFIIVALLGRGLVPLVFVVLAQIVWYFLGSWFVETITP